jgi:hypothetical protein
MTAESTPKSSISAVAAITSPAYRQKLVVVHGFSAEMLAGLVLAGACNGGD